MFEVTLVTSGMVLSITNALFAERELVSPGTGKIKFTSLLFKSFTLPPPVLIILKPSLKSPTKRLFPIIDNLNAFLVFKLSTSIKFSGSEIL